MPLTPKLPLLLAVGALAVGAGACGGGDDVGTAPPGPTASPPTGPPTVQVEQLTGYTTKISLTPRFRATLRSLGVVASPVGDATVSAAGVATFPITGGELAYYAPGTATPAVRGVVDHDGSGLALTARGRRVELADFTLDPGTSVLTGEVSIDGTVTAATAPLFSLDGATLKPLRLNADGTKAVLEGATVRLQEEAAELLDQAFGTRGLAGGIAVGVAKLTINTTDQAAP